MGGEPSHLQPPPKIRKRRQKRKHLLPFSASVRQFSPTSGDRPPGSPVHYQDNAVKRIKTNLLGTHHMLELAKQSARILLASTSEVYGDPQMHPQPET